MSQRFHLARVVLPFVCFRHLNFCQSSTCVWLFPSLLIHHNTLSLCFFFSFCCYYYLSSCARLFFPVLIAILWQARAIASHMVYGIMRRILCSLLPMHPLSIIRILCTLSKCADLKIALNKWKMLENFCWQRCFLRCIVVASYIIVIENE